MSCGEKDRESGGNAPFVVKKSKTLGKNIFLQSTVQARLSAPASESDRPDAGAMVR